VTAATVAQKEGAEYPYVKFELEVTEGLHTGHKLWTNKSVAPKSLWSLMALLKGLGVEIATDEPVDFEVDDESGAILEPELIGLVGLAAVDQREWQGRTVNDVAAVYPIGGALKKNGSTQFSLPSGVGAKSPKSVGGKVFR